MEIVIVNDGSKDNSLEIMKLFSDSRVIVVSQKNGGPSKIRSRIE